MHSSRRLPLLALVCTWAAAPAHAQWSSDPAQNLAVADAPGEQVQAKLAVTADGGAYLSWFDNSSGGYDVRLQRLDAAGNELWAHNGVLVADRGFSSTQDYALDVDAAGHALLAFRDDRFTGTQITAARVSPAGALDWGVNGVQLTSTTAFVAAPKICGTSDGDVVVAWTQDASVRAQRLDSAGVNQWGLDLAFAPGAGSFSASDVHDSGTDSILSIIHQTGGFGSPRHILASKIDAAGVLLWGGGTISVFDGGSLQIANFPTFVPDGSGGAVFAWYGVSPLQVYAQHVLANGSEAFPHNGSAGSANAAQLRVSPSVDYDSGSGETYLFWTETDAIQSQRGLGGQKFDAAGAAQWGANGLTLVPLGADDVQSVRTVVDGNGSFVFWDQIPGFGQDVTRGRHLDPAGTTDIATFDVASTPSSKARLQAALGTTGQVILAWRDERTDSGDVYAQNVNADGSLGGELGTPFCFGVGCPCGNDDPDAGCVNSTGSGATLGLGGSASVGADDLLLHGAGIRPNAPGLAFAGSIQLNGGNGNPFGDGLQCAGGGVKRLGVQVASPSGDATWGPGLVASHALAIAGQTRTLQIWYRDPMTGPCTNDFNTTHGVELVFQP